MAIPPYVFTRIPVVIPVPGVISIPLEDITVIGPNPPVVPEADAYEHWFLSDDDNSLVGRVHGRVLTPQAAGRVWSPDGVYIPSRGKALLTDFQDAAIQTVWGVFRREIPVGTCVQFGAGSHTTDGGSSFTSTSTVPANMIGIIRNSTTRTIQWPAAINIGDWAFLAISERYDGSNRLYSIYIGGASDAQNAVITGSAAKTLASRTIALGSAYSPIALEGEGIGVNCCEFGIKAAGLDRSQMDALYARCKTNQLKLGRTVK